MELTIALTVRVRVADGISPFDVEKDCLEYIHGMPGYVMANARSIGRHEDHTPCPYPLDDVAQVASR